MCESRIRWSVASSLPPRVSSMGHNLKPDLALICRAKQLLTYGLRNTRTQLRAVVCNLNTTRL